MNSNCDGHLSPAAFVIHAAQTFPRDVFILPILAILPILSCSLVFWFSGFLRDNRGATILTG
jgi:hypothetical protein